MIDKRKSLAGKYVQIMRKIAEEHDYSEIKGSKIKGKIIISDEEMKGKTEIYNYLLEKTGVNHTALKNFYVGVLQPKAYAELGKLGDPFTGTDTRDMIKKAKKWGKLVVLAHPFTESRVKLKPFYEKAMGELVEMGLGGLECSYPEHTAEHKRILKGYCKKYGLIPTGGSDFHRPGDPVFEMGRCGVTLGV